MIRLLGKIPRGHFHVACSGGTDSMMMVSFLMCYPRNQFDLLHFNHGTPCCDEADSFVTEFAAKHGIELHKGKISETRKTGESREDFWRRNRYSFLGRFSDEPIMMSHHLQDCIETWVMTSMSGNPRLIPYRNEKYNIIRPFLAVPKSEIMDWLLRHNVEHVIDKSNFDTTIKRNYVRHVAMPNILKINPGIEKTIRKKILEEYSSQNFCP